MVGRSAEKLDRFLSALPPTVKSLDLIRMDLLTLSTQELEKIFSKIPPTVETVKFCWTDINKIDKDKSGQRSVLRNEEDKIISMHVI